MTTNTRRGRSRAILLSLVLGIATGASTATLAAVSGSPDITIDQAGTIVRPGGVSDDIEIGMPSPIDLGPLPEAAQVTAYSPGSPPVRYFTLGHTMSLPGGITARPRDVVQWDGLAYEIALDGGSVSFPDGIAIDAISVDPFTGDVWLSFDSTVDLFGSVLRDADVFDVFTLAPVFDASGAGVPDGTDVDAVSHVPNSGDILLSFDVGGTLGSVTFADEDVLRYDPAMGTWTLEIDASASNPNWGAADLDAMHLVPEPQFGVGLCAGMVVLCGLTRRRRRL